MTFSIIKPDAYEKGHMGDMLSKIEAAGFRVVAARLTQLSLAQAGKFYEVHKERPFYDDLCRYMSSGPVLVFVLKAERAVERFRELIGNTDPEKAAPNTLRKLYATSIEANAIHGSDSDENAQIEARFFFAQQDMLA